MLNIETDELVVKIETRNGKPCVTVVPKVKGVSVGLAPLPEGVA